MQCYSIVCSVIVGLFGRRFHCWLSLCLFAVQIWYWHMNHRHCRTLWASICSFILPCVKEKHSVRVIVYQHFISHIIPGFLKISGHRWDFSKSHWESSEVVHTFPPFAVISYLIRNKNNVLHTSWIWTLMDKNSWQNPGI